MAAELGKFIVDQLERLPQDHPDRVFLQEELGRIGKHEYKKSIDAMNTLKEEVAKDPIVIEIRARIRTLVQEDNKLQYPDLEGKIPDSHIKGNRRKAEKFIEKYGDQSIVDLLPEDARLFGRVINTSLHSRAHVFTKRQLIDFPREEIIKLKGTGTRTYPFIYAMQDLAIAEFSAKQIASSNQIQDNS